MIRDKKYIASKMTELNNLSVGSNEIFINILFEIIIKELQKHGSINLVGFVIFDVFKSKARKGVNPQTLEKIMIPAKYKLRTRFSKAFNKQINYLLNEKKYE